MHIEHRPDEQAFYLTSNGHEGELTYARPSSGVADFQHTYVDEELRGHGAADQLVRHALDWARDQNLRVRASCPFVKKFIDKHQSEYQELMEA